MNTETTPWSGHADRQGPSWLTRCAVALGCLCAVSATAAAAGKPQAFVLQDYFGHRWSHELVFYDIEFPPDTYRPDQVAISKREGNLEPVQLSNVRLAGDGTIRSATVAFFADLEPLEEAVYRIVPGSVQSAAQATVAADGDAWLLSSGTVAVRVPKFDRTWNPPVVVEQVSPPLLAVRANKGRWLGEGRFEGPLQVTKAQSTIIAQGPLYAEVRVSYEFTEGRHDVVIRVVAGEDVVLCREDFDTGSPGETPRRFVFSPMPSKKLELSANGQPAQANYRDDRRLLSILGYMAWASWPGSTKSASLYDGTDPRGFMLTVFPVRIGQWRNPLGIYVMQSAKPELYLAWPLAVDQVFARDGGVYGEGTGSLEPGWPPYAARRQWAMWLGAASDVPASAEAFEGSRMQQTIVKFRDLPLDKIKDWVIEWDAPPPSEYPRLYIPPEKRASHIATTEEFHSVLEDRRTFVRQVLQQGLVGNRTSAPNNNRCGSTGFDVAMSARGVPSTDREELCRLMTFAANVNFDQDYNPALAGFHRGNPNMPPTHEHTLVMNAAAMPSHPDAPKWLARGQIEPDRQFAANMLPCGSWSENPGYQLETHLEHLMESGLVMKNTGIRDLFAGPQMQKTWDYLLNLLAPPDPRFGLRMLPPIGNMSHHLSSYWGGMAAFTRDSSPEFSARMQWAWQQQGALPYTLGNATLSDPSLPATVPDLHSTYYEGFGCTLRSGFPSPHETMLYFRLGLNTGHFTIGDEGSIILYAKGAPLVLHFGSCYTPYLQGAQFFNRPNLDHATESSPYNGLPTPFTSPVVKDFVHLGEADYVRGEFGITHLDTHPDDPRPVPGPPVVTARQPPAPRAIEPTLWTRQILFLKDTDPDGPNYFLIRDDSEPGDERDPAPVEVLGDRRPAQQEPMPRSEWNLWCLAENVEYKSDRVVFIGQHGVDLDVIALTPSSPAWDSPRFDGHKNMHWRVAPIWKARNGDKPWVETQINIRTHQPPDGDYLFILYPRFRREAQPIVSPLADGQGACVTMLRGKDWVFLAEKEVVWRASDSLAWRGAAGAIRQADRTWSAVLTGPATASFDSVTIATDGPLAARLEQDHLTLDTDPRTLAVTVTSSANRPLRITAPAFQQVGEGVVVRLLRGPGCPGTTTSP